MKIAIWTLLLFFVAFSSCIGKSRENVNANSSEKIPEDAIPFEYDNDKKAILLNGKLNDSIPMLLYFETGWLPAKSDNRILISDSLKNIVKDGNCVLQVGKINKNYDVYFWDKDYFLFQYLGQNVTFLEWSFFNDKIVELSFSKKYIRILNDTQELSGYKSLPLSKGDKECYNCLSVEIDVYIQGKHIKEYVLLDTGFNGSVNFNHDIIAKYGIDTSDALHVSSLNKPIDLHQLSADSVKFGYSTADNQKIGFMTSDKGVKYPYSGLLGNSFLEKFDIVFDFKDFKFYIKPIEGK